MACKPRSILNTQTLWDGVSHVLEPLPLSSLTLQHAHLLLLPLSSYDSRAESYILYLFVDILTVFIHSSQEFGKHLYDHYFELFIR